MLLGTILLVMGAYFIFAIAIFNVGMKAPRVQKMVETFSVKTTKIFYAVLGIISVAFGIYAIMR